MTAITQHDLEFISYYSDFSLLSNAINLLTLVWIYQHIPKSEPLYLFMLRYCHGSSTLLLGSLVKSHPLCKESLDYSCLQTLYIHISVLLFFQDAIYYTHLSHFVLCPLLECIFHEGRKFLTFFFFCCCFFISGWYISKLFTQCEGAWILSTEIKSHVQLYWLSQPGDHHSWHLINSSWMNHVKALFWVYISCVFSYFLSAGCLLNPHHLPPVKPCSSNAWVFQPSALGMLGPTCKFTV